MARRRASQFAVAASIALAVMAVESPGSGRGPSPSSDSSRILLGESHQAKNSLSGTDQPTGTIYLDSGYIDEYIPDNSILFGDLPYTSEAPAGAKITDVEYEFRIADDGDGNFACDDYIVSIEGLIVYSRLGGRTDGDFDDDFEDDLDIEIHWRGTSHFNGQRPNRQWNIVIFDRPDFSVPGYETDGILNYIRLRIHWEVPPPSISIGNKSVTEGDIGTTLAELAVSLSSAAEVPVSVDWSTSDDSADSIDYAPASGTVSFTPGETTKTLTIVVFGDTDEEPDEVFHVNLSNPINAPINDGQGLCTILDDDRPVIVILHDQTGSEGTTGVSAQDFETENDDYDTEAADDFVVPDGGWWINKIELRGLYLDGNGPAEGLNLWFYRDNNGWPSDRVVCGYSEVVPTSDGASEGSFGMIVVDLPTPCVLSPGRHWLAAQARMDYSDGGQFFWSQRTEPSGQESVWRNPGDGFEWGLTSWTRLTTAFPDTDDPDLIFRLTGLSEVPPLFVDGFESGDCAAWSAEVP